MRSEDPVFLQPDVRIDLEPDRLTLTRQGVPVEHRLGVAEALALGLLAETGSPAHARSVLGQAIPGGRDWVDRAMNRYWTYLGDGPPRPLAPDWIRQVTASRPRIETLPMSRIRAEAAPAAITWMVTLGCDRRCPYCFFEVFRHRAEDGSPPDATLPKPIALRVVEEMAAIGAADLYLTGGEPLLRRDLPEIIAEASRRRIRCHLVTKFAITPPLARRLAEAGLASITISLDDGRSRQAAALAGAPGFLDEVRHAISSTLAVGLALEVNAVATSVNIGHLAGLAQTLVDWGVPTLRVSPFSPPYPGRAAAQRLETPIPVGPVVEQLGDRYRGRIRVLAGSGAVADGQSDRRCGEQAVCEIGIRALDLLPDGSVTRCHYLPGREDMIVGSVLEETLLQIWRGSRLRGLTRPKRAAYAGTACSGCGSFEGCHSRGRCYVSALATAGKPFAPDQFCTADASP